MKTKYPLDLSADHDPIARLHWNPPFDQVLSRRYSRRDLLKLGAGLGGALLCRSIGAMSETSRTTLTFPEVARAADGNLHVPPGYRAEVLIRWGDPLFADMDDFDPHRQSARSQERRFGFNNDFIGFIPVPGSEKRSVLFVNHEFTQSALMFPGSPQAKDLSLEQIDIEIAAHGASIVEIENQSGRWTLCRGSALNKRITPWTPMRFDGPAAGARRLQTVFSKSGLATVGTYANCGGGVTPWGTFLSAEENINFYFDGMPKDDAEIENHRRMGLALSRNPPFHWGRFHDRWNLQKNPTEPLQVGWIVEIDPFDSDAIPVKHTAFGRFKHEACSLHINRDGRLVAYMGDDQVYEYVYRYVSKNRYNAGDHKTNRLLLAEGLLSVAEFRDDGTVLWHPLEFGTGPLTERNGFHSQADVLIDTRQAADLLGATPMDRPEDIEVNPLTGEIFVMLTKNGGRGAARIDRANPRAENTSGHILTLQAPDNDHSRNEFRWDLFLLAGDPRDHHAAARYPEGLSPEGWLSNPDNCAFDRNGRLWIATDGNQGSGESDGVWACDTQGPGRGLTRRFLRLPFGAEATGPCFSRDNRTFFLSVQHPADGSTFDEPSTRWPDFQSNLPPRPSVIAVYREDSGPIGS
ncbi:MAG: PhoX family protein [Gammaproteobacteria bacterium]